MRSQLPNFCNDETHVTWKKLPSKAAIKREGSRHLRTYWASHTTQVPKCEWSISYYPSTYNSRRTKVLAAALYYTSLGLLGSKPTSSPLQGVNNETLIPIDKLKWLWKTLPQKLAIERELKFLNTPPCIPYYLMWNLCIPCYPSPYHTTTSCLF